MPHNLDYPSPSTEPLSPADGVAGALGVPGYDRSVVRRDAAKSFVSQQVIAAAPDSSPNFSCCTAGVAHLAEAGDGGRLEDQSGAALLAERSSGSSLRGWLRGRVLACGERVVTFCREVIGLRGEWVDRAESRFRGLVDRVFGSSADEGVRGRQEIAQGSPTGVQSLSSRCTHALGAIGGAVAALFGRSHLSRSTPLSTPPRYENMGELHPRVREALASTDALFKAEGESELRREKGEEVLNTLRRNLNAVSVEEFSRLEDGKRLGSSGKNILHVPEGMAANFDLSRLSETGIVVFVNGISLTGQDGVRGYVRTVAQYYGRPVLLIVNDENGLYRAAGDPRGDRRPNKYANVVHSAISSALGHIDARIGEQAEPSVSMLSRAYEEVLAAGLKNNVSLAHSQGCNITSMGVLKVKRENPRLFERFKSDFEVEGVAPVECRYPPGIRVRLWGREGDPLMQLGGVLDAVMEPFHTERFSRSDKIIRLPGESHDFDECVPQYLSTVVMREALARGASAESGEDFALQVIESVANARYGDAVFDQIFATMLARRDDPRLSVFARAFADTIRRFCPDGRIGRYVVPAGG